MLTPGPTRTSTPSSTILTGESDSTLLSRSEHFIDSLELTEKEKIEKAKKEKIILHGNTRLARTPWKSESQEEKIRKAVENREAMEAGENTDASQIVFSTQCFNHSGKVGVDGKEMTRPETPSVNGFKLMSMAPSPALGVEVCQ